MRAWLPVCLVKDHVLHTLQLQVHLLDDVHETPGGADDSGERLGVRDQLHLLLGSCCELFCFMVTHMSGFS